jgi:hypothetical protein
MVIFLTARSTSNTAATIAFACPCLEDKNGRPIAGFINWGPNRISLDPLGYPMQLGVGIHEMVIKFAHNSSFARLMLWVSLLENISSTQVYQFD